MSDSPDRESRTEEPTEKRLADALKKGKTPVSRELPILLGVGAIWLCFSVLTGERAGQIALALRPFIDQPGGWALASSKDVLELMRYVGQYALLGVLPLAVAIGAGGLIGSASQSSGMVLERIKPDFSRISPTAGWKRHFGRGALTEGLKAVLKVGLVGLVAFWIMRGFLATLMASSGSGAEEIVPTLGSMLTRLSGGMVAAFLLVALVDLALVRYFWRRDLRMTKQEQRDEAKETDGDQTVKSRMRMLARQRLKKRMMAAVPRATVVIANPTHYAVALRYVRSEGGAPRVVAKGRDRMALKIRALAEQLDIPVIENKWLARSLHDNVPVDALIPPEFYKAVARIISFLNTRGKAHNRLNQGC